MTENSNTQYNNNLSNAEEGKLEDINVLIVKKQCCTESLCIKSLITISVTAIMSPFIICDIYFAMTDVSCVDQKTPKMDIVMRVYLLSSGLISLITTSLVNIYIFNSNLNESQNSESEDGIICIANMLKYTLQVFNFSWLITGCVLFWAYMDMNACAKPVYNYLMARFILGIITTAASSCASNNTK